MKIKFIILFLLRLEVIAKAFYDGNFFFLNVFPRIRKIWSIYIDSIYNRDFTPHYSTWDTQLPSS